MNYQTRFNDISIDPDADISYSGIATWAWDETWEDYYVDKLELFNVTGPNSQLTIRRRNKDEIFNLVFSKMEDALMQRVVSTYTSPAQHFFYESL